MLMTKIGNLYFKNFFQELQDVINLTKEQKESSCTRSRMTSAKHRTQENKLEQDLRHTQKSAYAKGTIINLVCQWRSFYKIYEKV